MNVAKFHLSRKKNFGVRNTLTKFVHVEVVCLHLSFQSEECLSQEEACLRHCRARLDHIKEHADERKSAVVLWKKKRLDRMLVDHCLRSGFYETAIKLAEDSHIEVGLRLWSTVYMYFIRLHVQCILGQWSSRLALISDCNTMKHLLNEYSHVLLLTVFLLSRNMWILNCSWCQEKLKNPC